MQGTYTVWLGKESVGQAIVERQGLYYCFQCRCQLLSGVMCRVTVSCGNISESLGVLVPAEGEYCLTKKIPSKNLPSGTPEFWITPKLPHQKEICVDVYPEEPFQYIAKLEKAYLDRRQSGLRIRIEEGETQGSMITSEYTKKSSSSIHTV